MPSCFSQSDVVRPGLFGLERPDRDFHASSRYRDTGWEPRMQEEMGLQSKLAKPISRLHRSQPCYRDALVNRGRYLGERSAVRVKDLADAGLLAAAWLRLLVSQMTSCV
jgi:hypothetical protein